jgi:hypothetical protein
MGIIYNRGLRYEAKLRNDVHYFTGKPCKYEHIEKRLVSNGRCMECSRLSTLNGRNKETDEQRLLRLQKSANRASEWRTNNPNHENTKFVKSRWKKENPEKRHADVAKRRASKLQRTPPWLNAGHWLEIDSIYELCAAWRSIGFDYHVDHIVPLQGKKVSGFHAPWNLQILTAKENIGKGNRF